MDGESNHLRDPPPLISNLSRPIIPTSSSSSFGLHKSSESNFLRSVQEAFKRHRSNGMMSSNNFLPRRCLPPQKETSQNSGPCSGLTEETKRTVNEAQEDASLTLPSISGTITGVYDDKYNPYEEQENQAAPLKGVEVSGFSFGQPKHAPVSEGLKKVQFSSATSQGGSDQMATRMDKLGFHMDSLALTGMEWEVDNQPGSSSAVINEPKHHNLVNVVDPKGGLRAEQGNASLEVRMSSLQNQIHHLRNFVYNESSNPATQSSVAGSSCVTTTSVHATSAPMLNSTTHSESPHQDNNNNNNLVVKSLADANPNPSNIVPSDNGERPLSSTTRAIPSEVKGGIQQRNLGMQSQVSSNPSLCYDQSKKRQGASKSPCYDTKLEASKSEKHHDKAPAQKKGYDPDLFFKVNGKLYQRLGKIGSGGSSEVHKVISSDCTVYALKKIKLKGRDYATAYGFCQEILYLKKLKGKHNIIQLIDYEVTDKALLHEVMNGCVSNKDNKVKDDGYIYMVLEYGEIDLAHMLSQKWKEIDNSSIDENWLRFYWQQMLQAVNKIHEERIVHSDLKPANFLLVKGSLKLIDFGIAKAIMSDTTNIQRDAQVGTLSYMSPEAFMCNESDSNGNVIKCGRPSDIWSLGCILYQMVYGRTPFSEYKTFWAKFKVITDPAHEITYGPIPNPWLLDLMKKCLAWDRNLRWRIPQLLQHPFLVPPVPAQLSPPLKDNCKAVELISECCANDPRVTILCSELQQLLGDPTRATRDQQSRLLLQISSICLKIREHMIKTS